MRQGARFSHLVATFVFMWLIYHAQRGSRWDTHTRALWQQRFAAHLLKVMHLKVETRGLPPEGSFIAANHQGYMDILVMASLMPQVFLSKHSVADWPFIGIFVKMAGTLFIDRGRRSEVSTQEAGFANAIQNKVGMTVYLEGTSTCRLNRRYWTRWFAINGT
jgi:lyso-ornithine lipid O-acyltransferase